MNTLIAVTQIILGLLILWALLRKPPVTAISEEEARVRAMINTAVTCESCGGLFLLWKTHQKDVIRRFRGKGGRGRYIATEYYCHRCGLPVSKQPEVPRQPEDNAGKE